MLFVCQWSNSKQSSKLYCICRKINLLSITTAAAAAASPVTAAAAASPPKWLGILLF